MSELRISKQLHLGYNVHLKSRIKHHESTVNSYNVTHVHAHTDIYIYMKQGQKLTFMDPCIKVPFLQKVQQDATVYQSFIIAYLNEAQHVSGDTLPIIRSLKLRKQPLVLHTWKVVGRVVVGRCQVALPDSVQ